jgi:hypothetical protein
MSTTTLHYGSRGASVTRLQRALNTNPYHAPRRKLVVDGAFGSLTGAACQQAKYWCGYAKDDIEPVAGTPLRSYLDKTRPLTEEMRARRKARLEKAAAAAKVKPLRVKALTAAKADIGILEKQPNIIKYNAWWNNGADHEPYCVRAGSYWYAKAGSTVPNRAAGRYQGTDYLLEDAKHGRNGVHLTSDPNPGDGFVIDFDGHSDPDHFGLYAGDEDGGQFHSVEANATLANGRQGVGMHTRPASQCWFIVFER